MSANGPTINQGNNGFHLFTVVTDGYGNLIAENEHGSELARASVLGHDDDDPAPFVELTRKTFFRLNAENL